MATFYSNPYTEDKLSIPQEVAGDSPKIATCKDKYLRDTPLVRPTFIGTGGASLAEISTELHRVITMPMSAGHHTYTVSLLGYTKYSVGLIPIPPGTVQLVLSCRMLMQEGKTTADYGELDENTEWGFKVLTFQEIPESDVLIINNVTSMYASGLGGVANISNVADKIEAVYVGGGPYAIFKGNEDENDTLINVHPGMSFVKVQLTRSVLPEDVTGLSLIHI